MQMEVFISNFDYFQKSPKYSGVKVWNDINPEGL